MRERPVRAPKPPAPHRWVWAPVLCGVLWACGGADPIGPYQPPGPGQDLPNIPAGDGDGMSINPSTEPPGPGDGDGNNTPTTRTCDRKLTGARAVMLEPRQYENALRDLVGYTPPDAVELPPGLDAHLDVLDRPWVTTSVLDRVMRDAENAAESLRGRTAQFLGCQSLTDPDCVRTGLSDLAKRAYVRAPEPSEIDALMALRAEALAVLPEDGGESAALLAVQAILAAPSTLYRAEFSTAANAGQRTLTAHERAEGIAAFLLDSVPDAELLTAADDGSLATDAGVRAQISRLLALPRVQRHLTGLMLNGYRATRVFESPKDEMAFPEFTGALQRSMFEESQRLVEDVLWTRNAPVSELLTSKTAFVDGALVGLYGLAQAPAGSPEEFTPVTLPAGRSGMLTEASVLAGLARTDKTSVVARGLFVRRDLLCLPKVPAPPDSVQAQVSMQLEADASEPELAAYRAMTDPCKTCHQQFDRFGLALEGFDPIGRTRLPAPGPIDLTGLAPLMGTIASADDLVATLVEDDRFTHCLAERLMDYALSAAGGGNAFCDSDALHQAIDASDGTLPAVIQAIVTHPAFAMRMEDKP